MVVVVRDYGDGERNRREVYQHTSVHSTGPVPSHLSRPAVGVCTILGKQKHISANTFHHTQHTIEVLTRFLVYLHERLERLLGPGQAVLTL